MRTFYTAPEAEILEFEAKDIITTSGGENSEIKDLGSSTANEEKGWTGFF